MKIYDQNQCIEQKEDVLQQIKQGAVFIYPTDTIYGIGCDAINTQAVKRIRELKERDEKPFSVIAPSIDWIKQSTNVNDFAQNNLQKLPGPYTLILELIKQPVSESVAQKTIGVRIPDHWCTQFLQQTNVPIVTTSVNLASQPFMTSLETANKDILENVDFVIYEGEKSGNPSTIINTLTQEIIER